MSDEDVIKVSYCVKCGKIFKEEPDTEIDQCPNGCTAKYNSALEIPDTYAAMRYFGASDLSTYTSTLIHSLDFSFVPFIRIFYKLGIRPRWSCSGHVNDSAYLSIDYDSRIDLTNEQLKYMEPEIMNLVFTNQKIITFWDCKDDPVLFWGLLLECFIEAINCKNK